LGKAQSEIRSDKLTKKKTDANDGTTAVGVGAQKEEGYATEKKRKILGRALARRDIACWPSPKKRKKKKGSKETSRGVKAKDAKSVK